jgi:uncharacterized protein YbjT (DUF2867 family)
VGAAKILVTGSTGTVGGHVARLLAAEGVRCQVMVRTAEAARHAADVGYDVVMGDFADQASLVSAFEGAECLFLVAPLVPELEELECHAIAAAEKAGIRRVVKLSTAGVAQAQSAAGVVPRQYPLHQRSEERLERSGLAYTHLRPGPFMQNTLNFAPAVVAEGLFRGSWGDGRMAYVDVRDVAAAATTVLREDGHEGRAYELTGPEALSPSDVASKLSVATGTTIRYLDVPREGVRQAMLQRGMSEWFADAMVEVMDHTREGAAGHLTDHVLDLTGRPPVSYDEFAAEHASLFRAA